MNIENPRHLQLLYSLMSSTGNKNGGKVNLPLCLAVLKKFVLIFMLNIYGLQPVLLNAEITITFDEFLSC